MAQKGTSHHVMHQATSVLLLPLTIWFAISAIMHAGDTYAAFTAWMAAPLSAVLLTVFIATACFHFKLVMEVVIDDYIPRSSMRTFCHRANTVFMLISAVLGIWAILAVVLMH